MISKDTLNVIHACAAGIDVHKMQVTATVRLARENADADVHTQEFSALPCGLAALSEWLVGHGATAAAMEGTGICQEAACDAVAAAGIEPLLRNRPHPRIRPRLHRRPEGTVCHLSRGSRWFRIALMRDNADALV